MIGSISPLFTIFPLYLSVGKVKECYGRKEKNFIEDSLNLNLLRIVSHSASIERHSLITIRHTLPLLYFFHRELYI